MVVGGYTLLRDRCGRGNGMGAAVCRASGALALAFFLFAMEEISWGQRIVGFDSPEALIGVNQQGEATIHNLPELAIIIFCALFWASVAGFGRTFPPDGLAVP